MKEEYVTPEMEIVEFEIKDVIATSCTNDTEVIDPFFTPAP